MNIILPQHEKRFALATIILAVLVAVFWLSSRYPALDEKAMMAGAIQLEDSLSFEALFPVNDAMGFFERLFWSTLNWVNTNKKGMTFGVLFATAFLTAAAHLKQRSFRGGLSNSFLGLAIGTPLGVCVNCAAPIAKGMYSAGMRAETTLSAMIASPTLNIVVLTMVFSIMPLYMAILKIGFSLLIILVAVPLICRTLPQREVMPVDTSPPAFFGLEGPAAPEANESLFAAFFSVLAAFLQNLWYIVKLTVPLMLLAGLLGALVATALPDDVILGLPFAVWILVPIVLVGVFLPVPIAFDVVVTGGLLGLGLSHGYVMALLFTLGSFSIYSFLIIYASVGRRAAWGLAVSVAILGVLAGGLAEGYHRWQTKRALELLLQEASAQTPTGLTALFVSPAHAAGADPLSVTSPDAARITIAVSAFKAPSPAASTPFTRIEAIEIGIDKPVEFSMRDMWPPFWEGRSLSSGDYDRDGDIDLIIASTEIGLYAYLNDGAGQFTRQTLPLGALAKLPVFNAALADLDNDGWPDLTIATYLNGTYFWKNHGGAFGDTPPVKLPNRDDTPLAMALTFADADQNGFLDIALGNWAAGWYRHIPGNESRNRILWTDAGQPGARQTDLPGIPGETLSILFSDLNGDGKSDLLVGNDFAIPDYFYLGDGKGGFSMIDHASGQIPHTTTTTMAIKTGFLSGTDKRPDIYLAQIAGRSSGVSETLKMQDLSLYCAGIKNPTAKATCEKNMAIKRWYKSGNNFDPTYAGNCAKLTGRDKAECRAMLVKDLAIQKRDPSVCQLIPKAQIIPQAYCLLHFKPPRPIPPEEGALTHQQILRSNVQLSWAGAAYADTADASGLAVGGWSWDTKIADFDLDGDLDVYIVNGTWVPNEVSPSNLYFMNDGTGKFTEASGPMGLEDYLMTASATQFDADGDGDLDMLSHPVNGPLVFFRNNSQNRAIGFALTDHSGNRDAIGAMITLTDSTGRVQRSELQLGGGFMSFDAAQLHFGLGRAPHATKAQIRWPDGSETHINGPLEPGTLYHVTRQ